MEYKRLGKSGLQVSRLSFGSWLTFGKQIADNVAEECMTFAYDAGINFFDNAEIYARGQSEAVMGNILKKKGWQRDSYIISSKVFFGVGDKPTQKGLHRKHVFEACHDALKRLQVDYLDLYYCHRPDKNTPIEETVWTMHNLIQQGKVLYWGTSEWSAQQITEAHGLAKQHHLIPPTMEQPQYNMFHRERFEIEYARLYDTFGMGTTIWSPLASGLLTGKYNNGMPKENTRMTIEGLEWLKERTFGEHPEARIEKIKKLASLADNLSTNLPKIAIAWCLKNPNVSTVITGASKVDQLKNNLKAIETLPLLTSEIMEKIEDILENKPAQPAF